MHTHTIFIISILYIPLHNLMYRTTECILLLIVLLRDFEWLSLCEGKLKMQVYRGLGITTSCRVAFQSIMLITYVHMYVYII